MSALDSSPITEYKVRSAGTLMISAACVIAMLYFGRLFFVTLLSAVIIAFILEPAVVFFIRMNVPRGFASFIVCSLALLLLYLLGLAAYTQISVLLDDLPSYSARINELSGQVVSEAERLEQSVYSIIVPKKVQEREKLMQQQQQQQQAANNRRRRPPDPVLPPPVPEVRIKQENSPVLTWLYTYARSFYDIVLAASFVPFLVYFMLSWRDHMRHNFLMLFEGETRTVAKKTLDGIADIARAYVVGNFILGILLTVASCIFFYLFRIPYWLLVGPLSAFMSLIPYIGLPFAIIPPVFTALTLYSTLTPYFVIATTIAFFHLLALNLVYPKLVGGRVHLNPLFVTVALMFWGTLWGGAGLVLAIPITAAIKAVCDSVTSLEPYGKLLGD